MRLIEISQPVLFKACSDVLDAELVPTHYSKLTQKAVKLLGYDEEQVQMSRVIEDVRQWLPERKYDVFYTQQPHYMMAKRRWFRNGQLALGNFDEPIQIGGSVKSGIDGAFVALMRSPYMQDHWNGNVELRNRKRAQGLVIEQHVKDWFKAMYPDFYQEADNYTNWQKPCPNDFVLDIDGRGIGIDVAGQNGNGAYGGSKRATDIHLLCRVENHHVLWTGVEHGKNWNEYVLPESASSPQSMLVWLNCAANDVDYYAIRSKAM